MIESGAHAVRRVQLPEEIRDQLRISLLGSDFAPTVIQRLERDGEFLRRTFPELVIQFPDKWIAIGHLTILSAQNSYIELVKSLNRMGENPGVVLKWWLQ